MTIEQAFERFIGQEVLVYTSTSGTVSGGVIECTVEEVGEGYVRVSQGDEDERNESIVNIRNIIRIREYPRKKNGKKKVIFE